jgi:putative transcriptional regulator
MAPSLILGRPPTDPIGRVHTGTRTQQADLAERLNVARQSVNAIETGNAAPSLPLGMRIARLFGQPVEAIFELDI